MEGMVRVDKNTYWDCYTSQFIDSDEGDIYIIGQCNSNVSITCCWYFNSLTTSPNVDIIMWV